MGILTQSTLRSRVWHQNNREKTSKPAQYIVVEVLRLPPTSLISRQLCFFLVFLISGLLHATIDVSAGIPWHDSGAVRFFCTQALGIWIEEGTAAVFCSVTGASEDAGRPPRWKRLAGYVWVVLFLAWSWPAYMYPMLYRTRANSEDSFLPFSVLGRLF